MARRSLSLLMVTLLVPGVLGCVKKSEPKEPGASNGGSTPYAESAGPYDPAEDPLVNPPELFEPAPEDVALIDRDATLFRVMNGNPETLTPIFFTSTYEFYISALMYEGLFTFGADLQWRINDTVVADFQESEDHKTYTVKLKPGLTWHDGAPFTAHDVVFSYENIMDERVPCPAQRSGTDELESVTAADDLTVVMEHKEALPTNCWNATFGIIPKHLFEKDKEANPNLKTGDYYNRLNRNPVGSGPYKFAEWLDNDKIVLERWEDYPGEKPHFKRIVLRIIPDANILLLSFNRGDVDEFRMRSKQFATQTLVGSDFAKVGYKVFKPQWSYSYISWNMDGSNPFFSDRRVRRAMTMACNLNRMRRDVGYNLVEPCHGIFHPDSWMYNPAIQLLPYNLEEASRLLDEAGWKIDTEREGWRHKIIDGVPTKFEFTLLIPQGSSSGVEVAAIFQEDLKKIGVSLKTQIMEWATFSERQRKHQFQAGMAAWGTGVDPDTNWNIWHSDQYDPGGTFGRNYVGFRNDRVDELFEKGRHEFDQEKRKKYYQELSKIIYDEQPYTFLWNVGVLWGVNNRIRGVTTSPRGIFNFAPAETAWWIPASAD